MTTESDDAPLAMADQAFFRDQLGQLLDQTELFTDLTFQEVRALAGYMRIRRETAGAVLFQEGDEGASLMFIIEGKVDVIKKDRQERAKTVATLRPGKTLGEMALIDDEPRSATAMVAQAATLAVLSRENFQKLIEKEPALAVKIVMKLARLLSQRLRQASGLLVDRLDG